MPDSSASLLYFTQQARLHDRDRYLLSLCLPSSEREAVQALLAFNIEISRIPETVSEPMIGHIRFAWWREALAEIEEGKVRKHPVVEAIATLIQSGAFSAADFTPLLDAREEQFENPGFKTTEALENYCAATSSQLLALCLKANRQWQKEYETAIHHLGIAWALSGMLRALPHLAAQNRSPFPHDLLQKHGIANLQTATDDEKHRAAIAVSLELLELVESHMNRGVEALTRKPPKFLSAFGLTTHHYYQMLLRKKRSLLTLPPNAGRLMLPLKLLFI